MQNQQHQAETQKTKRFFAGADRKTWYKNNDQKTTLPKWLSDNNLKGSNSAIRQNIPSVITPPVQSIMHSNGVYWLAVILRNGP